MSEPFKNPRLRCIEVLLADGVDEDALRVAVQALNLGGSWVLRRVPLEPTRRAWDLVALFPIEPGPAWDLARKLRDTKGVEDAEPSFEATYAEGDPRGPVPQVFDAAKLNQNECDWSLRFVGAEKAWDLADSKARRGAGIRVGHPDSGFQAHRELGPHLKADEGWDFVENDAITENGDGGHGLGTASVIMSPDNRASTPTPTVTGIAPEADVIPLRVTKPHWFIPAPVLFHVGADRLRDAVWYAIARGVHVISISLGWLPHAGLHRAIQHAVRRDIIVIAAAGNYTGPIVVWPASYPEVIAMAACNSRSVPWVHSARGRAVDATGPGEDVWTAQPGDKVEKSSGTSHATATVAGIAALWLGHHGRDALLARYLGGPTLAEVFRHVLRASATQWQEDHAHWGAGLVNARACLEYVLPSSQTVLASVVGAPVAETAAEAFNAVPSPAFHGRLGKVFGVNPAEAPRLDAAHGRELRFWALTRAPLRRALLEDEPAAPEAFGTRGPSAVPPFSDGLRAHLDSLR